MDQRQEAQGIRSEVEKARSGPRKGKSRYPEALRLRILEHVARARAEGQKLPLVAAQLGISWQTVEYWRRRENPSFQEERPGSRQFVQIEVAEPQTKLQSIVVHGPRGVRIEGLSLEQLGELLRSLG
jgi:transposase-like protein